MRAAIWRNTILTAAAYAVAIFAVDRYLRSRMTVGREITLALAFSVVQIAAILVMVAALFARKRWNVARLARSRRLAPQIQEAVALHAIGIDQRARLQQLRRQAPHDMRETLFTMLASTRGAPREKVAMLAADLGLAEQRSQEVVEWIRNVIRLHHGERFEQIMAIVAHQSLLVRAIAAEELAPYAAEISESQLVHVFESHDPDVVMAGLDMLRAWRRAMHVPGFLQLLAQEDPRIRARALLALPYVAAAAQPEVIAPAIVSALNHQNADVRAAAATAAGRLGVTRAVEALGLRLADVERRVAVAAAFALVVLGESGNSALQRAILSPDRTAASVAFEALEKAALGRVEIS